MSEPFLSQISMFGFNFAPRQWAQCNGQLLSIAQNTALFSLLGTTFGGNGQTTFALPNLQGRVPIHTGTGAGLNVNLGQQGGAQNHTLNTTQIPAHSHGLAATSTNATLNSPVGNSLGKSNYPIYQSPVTPVPFGTGEPAGSAVSTVGGSQPHQNMQPFLVVNFCIALQGIYPSQS